MRYDLLYPSMRALQWRTASPTRSQPTQFSEIMNKTRERNRLVSSPYMFGSQNAGTRSQPPSEAIDIARVPRALIPPIVIGGPIEAAYSVAILGNSHSFRRLLSAAPLKLVQELRT